MSGIISRFKAIFQAQANAVADQMEDPKASLEYSLTRLQENRRQLSRSLVEVAAAKGRLETQQGQMATAVEKYADQARAAVEAGREDLARTALERKQEAEARRAELELNISRLEGQLDHLKQSQVNLDRKIELFRSKKEELKSIYNSSQAQLRVREALSGVSEDLADVGNTIQRAESRIQEMQSRADAIDALVSEGVLSDALQPEGDDIDRELARIGRSQAVEDELARIKAEAQHE
ncbi:MAG: PspA/IM30 family protein [Anaerolineae bacterium]|nr:PspA/IM30 family protein [Anaerolineae bacterium]